MKLFLTKYLKLFIIFYFFVGITLVPVWAQWFWPSMSQNDFIIVVAITAMASLIVSLVIILALKSIFWKLFLTVTYGLTVTFILFYMFDESPFVLASLGIVVLSGTMQFFDSIKDTFPNITNSEIKKWLEVTLTLFAVFVSSMMVGFTIAWNGLYAEVLKER